MWCVCNFKVSLETLLGKVSLVIFHFSIDLTDLRKTEERPFQTHTELREIEGRPF